MTEVNKDSVSVITCTNRSSYFQNILDNFSRQNHSKKELIIVLNNNKMDLKMYREITEEYENVYVYQLDEKKTLGKCLNFGIEKSNHNIIAKFDDDDYYGSNYLKQAVTALNEMGVMVVGKASYHIYFEDKKTLALRSSKRQNQYVPRVAGATIVFKKEVLEKVKFKNKTFGEDVAFCMDCRINGIKIYSTDKYNFVCIRHFKTASHTWDIDDNYYMSICDVIGKVDDFKAYVDS